MYTSNKKYTQTTKIAFFVILIFTISLILIFTYQTKQANAHPEANSDRCHIYQEPDAPFHCTQAALTDYFGEFWWAAAEIASGESNCKPTAVNINKNGSHDTGLFQINDLWCDGRTYTCPTNGAKTTLSSSISTCRTQLLNPEVNKIIACSKGLSNGGINWCGPYTTRECGSKWSVARTVACNLTKDITEYSYSGGGVGDDGRDVVEPGEEGRLTTPGIGPLKLLNIYPTIPYPGSDEGFNLNEALADGITICELFGFTYVFSIWLGGIIAVLVILYAGFIFIFSGARPAMRAKARERLMLVIWGLVILFLAVIILNIINPNIGKCGAGALKGITDEDVYFKFGNLGTPGEDDGGIGSDPGTFDCIFSGGGCTIPDDSSMLNRCSLGYVPDSSKCVTSSLLSAFAECEAINDQTCILDPTEAPPPSTEKKALCTTGGECHPWCYDPKFSSLRTDPKYTEEWPGIYPSAFTKNINDFSLAGWLTTFAKNPNVAMYPPFVNALTKTGQIAQSRGYKLNLISGYRPLYDQERILCFNGKRDPIPSDHSLHIEEMDADIGWLVARPGTSPHGVGVAVDVSLHTSGGARIETGLNCDNQRILNKIFFDADPNWYKYTGESWHFDYWEGSPPAKRTRDYDHCKKIKI